MGDIVKKLRYMAKMYSNGQVARGGEPEGKHYLDEAADEIERLRTDAARWNTASQMATQQADCIGPIYRIDIRRERLESINNAIDFCAGGPTNG